MLKRIFCQLLFVMCLIGAATANQRYQGTCQQSGITVLAGLNSTTTSPLTYPGATVTVTVVGGGIATIFSDNLGTPLANPFTASGTDATFSFYAANTPAARYSVTCSGTGIPTISINPDVVMYDPAVAIPGVFTTGNFSGNVSVGGTLGVTGPSTFSSITATSLDSILYAGGATYPCTSVGINAMLLATPSPSGAVHAEGCGSFTATTNIFAGVTGTGAIFMPCGVISTAVVQTVPTNWIVRGCGGEIATGAGLPTTGTVFKWTGGLAPATGVLNVFDTSHTNIYDIGIDCNSVASCVGINIDSDNTPISTFNSFTNILIMNAATGMQVGTAGGAQQVSALDVTGLRCVSVTDCVVSNSSNALAGAHFRHMTVSSATNGFHFIKGTFTQIEDCTGGNLIGSMFLVEYTISLIIKNCQSEPTGNFLTVQTNDNYTTPITLIGNTINRPISITQPASIISIGNHYTAIPTANNSALVTSVGDKYDNGMEWALSGNSLIDQLFSNATNGNPNQNYLNCGVGCNFTNLSNAIIASIANTGAASFAGQVTSTLATGTAPLVIASTTPVANLSLSGGAGTGIDNICIGCVTPAAGHFTTASATSQITSTLAIGTAPFVITSTTPVANLTVQNCGATCAITQPTISTGVSQGSGLKHQRFGVTCTTAAAANAACNTTYTWTSAFANASYTVVCSPLGAASGVPIIQQITNVLAASFDLTIIANSAVGAQLSGVQCIATHD